jgi:TonB family protein
MRGEALRTFKISQTICFVLAISFALANCAGRSWAQAPSHGDSSSVVPTAPGEYADDQVFARFERVTATMKPPKATYAPDPKFPDLPADAEQRGTVVMLVGINSKGHVEAVRVLRSDEHAFEESAVSTVKKWKFRPAQKDGQPVPVQVTVEMKFER